MANRIKNEGQKSIADFYVRKNIPGWLTTSRKSQMAGKDIFLHHPSSLPVPGHEPFADEAPPESAEQCRPPSAAPDVDNPGEAQPAANNHLPNSTIPLTVYPGPRPAVPSCLCPDASVCPALCRVPLLPRLHALCRRCAGVRSPGANQHPRHPAFGLRPERLGRLVLPLCQCHCCAGAVLASIRPVQLVSPATQWAIGLRHATLLVAAPTPIAGAVWQPPQA